MHKQHVLENAECSAQSMSGQAVTLYTIIEDNDRRYHFGGFWSAQDLTISVPHWLRCQEYMQIATRLVYPCTCKDLLSRLVKD